MFSSQTCPQCRKRCTLTTTIRVYFDDAVNDTLHQGTETESFINTIDNLKLKNRELEAKNKLITKELTNAQKLLVKSEQLEGKGALNELQLFILRSQGIRDQTKMLNLKKKIQSQAAKITRLSTVKNVQAKRSSKIVTTSPQSSCFLNSNNYKPSTKFPTDHNINALQQENQSSSSLKTTFATSSTNGTTVKKLVYPFYAAATSTSTTIGKNAPYGGFSQSSSFSTNKSKKTEFFKN